MMDVGWFASACNEHGPTVDSVVSLKRLRFGFGSCFVGMYLAACSASVKSSVVSALTILHSLDLCFDVEVISLNELDEGGTQM